MVFLALDGVQSLDVTGPMEVFAVANRVGGAYTLALASADGAPIATHAGLALGPAVALATLPERVDTIVIAGGSEAAMQAAAADGVVLAWLRQAPARARRVVGICTGGFVLAAAGLLDGRRVTTHWAAADAFGRLFPAVALEPDAIYVCDPPIYTSAGVTAGIDLALALVEADHGSAVALAVARELVLFLRRPGGQAQFSAGASLQVDGEPRIGRLVAARLDDPAGRVTGTARSVPALAESVGMSERSFLRAFRRATGTTPGRFVEGARLTRAKGLLETGHDPLDRVAERSGYGSVDALARAFRKRLGVTPGEYRARFGRLPRAGEATDR
ncbi:MAG: GlxA family transcriptional regulator [Salinarimonas sp.]